MNTKLLNKGVVMLAMAGGACASTSTVPERLQAAQRAYKHASEAQGADLVLVDLYRAQKTLKQSEDAWRADSKNPYVDDLAYIAEREAQLAEARGEAALADQKRKEAEHAVTQIYAEAAGRQERFTEAQPGKERGKQLASDDEEQDDKHSRESEKADDRP